MASGADRFAVEKTDEVVFGAETFALRDLQSGSEARIAPGYGATVYSFKPELDGQSLEMLYGWGRADLDKTRRLGNPIFFQPLNALPGGRSMVLRGEKYEVAVDANGRVKSVTSVHDRPWQVEEARQTPRGARLRCVIRSDDMPETRGQVASAFQLTATFTLQGNEIRLDFDVRNVGDGNLPMRLGFHPWFCLPLSPAGSREECLIQVPARGLWDLDGLNKCEGRTLQVPPEADFRRIRPLGQMIMNHEYTDLEAASGANDFILRDPVARAELVVRADAAFRENIVFTPVGAPTLCFEPWTSPWPLYELEAQGLAVGLITLAPGATWTGWMSFIGRTWAG